MEKIYSTEDRIKIKVDGLVVTISPLSFEQKIEINAEIMKTQMTGDPKGAMNGAGLVVKYGVKDIEGLSNSKGESYKLSFDEKGLSDKCLDDLFNLTQGEKLSMACLNLLQSVPSQFINTATGEKLDGVSFIKEKSSRKK